MTSSFHKLSPVAKGLVLLTLSSMLFASMGVFIRFASQTTDNATVVFFRNLTALCILVPWFASRGWHAFLGNIKTEKLWMHTWRSVIGLAAMYGFFYAIAHMKLSNAMVFTYSSPVFIPLIAWLFLKEKMTARMWLAAGMGLVGVILVAKPDTGMFNTLSLVGLSASFCAAMAFVTVRALTDTEPATRIVFYFAVFGTVLSFIPVAYGWLTQGFNVQTRELIYLVIAGTLATFSQIAMSKAYSYAPAGSIGPANYLAIFFAGIWGAILWQEYPDAYSLIGMTIIFTAILICMPNFVGNLCRLFKS